MLRNEKDKVLSMEIQVKSIKMESDLAIKEKIADISQLKREI